MMTLEQRKQCIAEAACKKYVHQDGIYGLGTGSTAHFLICAIGKMIRSGQLRIKGAVATSQASHDLALSEGIPLLRDKEITHIDIAFDGADEFTLDNLQLKGGGGALLREKIVAQSAHQWIVIADDTKLSSTLHRAKIVIEVLPFCQKLTEIQLGKWGFEGQFRKTLSDNNNALFDIMPTEPLLCPKEVDEAISRIPGVLATGIFINLATACMWCDSNGEIHSKEFK